MSGLKVFTDAAERERRNAVCAACPFLQAGRVRTCGKCGCFIAARVALTSGTCPINHW